MNVISLQNIEKSYGTRLLFKEVNITFTTEKRLGLVGINGTGKSTFLKILAGQMEPDKGTIERNGKASIHYLAQTPEFDPDSTLLEAVLDGDHPRLRMVQSFERISREYREMQEAGGEDAKVSRNYMNALEQMDQQDGWQVEQEARIILSKLGFPDVNQKVAMLSGGQKRRLALGQALLYPCDLLLLDEPTNHLDNGMIEYLEKFLIKWSKGLLMVTHDRYFLERVVNRIIEIDHGQIYKYEANYSKYLELKQARLETQLSSQRKRKLFLKKELEWVRAGVQARTTKSKDRLQRFEELSKVKDVEVNGKVEMIHTFSRLGKKTIELHEISKSFEQKKLFDEFSYMFKQHDRIGILGDNGTGKSTLLNIITGNLKSDMGYVEIGETVRFGYFKQGYDDLPMNKKVIDYIQEISNDFKVDGQGLSAKDMLERFLFDSRLQHTPISRLSGGERRRLYLLRVLMMMPNVLVLDEPTNDLDIDTLNILEDYLDNFEGIIMTVSHDRYFLDRICDGLFILQNQHLRYVNGGYSQNLDTTTKEEKEKSQGALAYKQSKQKKIKMTYMEKKEFEEIEDIIMDLETNLSQIEEKMNGVTDFKEIDKLSKQRDDLQKQIDEKNERYLYLLELQEQIDNQ